MTTLDGYSPDDQEQVTYEASRRSLPTILASDPHSEDDSLVWLLVRRAEIGWDDSDLAQDF